MFRKSTETALYERLLEEKDKQIAILADEIDHLRLQLGTPSQRQVVPFNPSEQPPMVEGALPFVPEEEEDLYHALEQGVIDNDELEAALQTLRARGPA